jgi:DNA processing protein
VTEVVPAGGEALFRLALVRGLGPARMETILRGFGSAEAALGTDAKRLAELPGIGPTLSARVAAAGGAAGEREARAARERLEASGARVLIRGLRGYPEALERLADPPVLLFTAGDHALLDTPGIAIVGTRAPTAYGRRTARGLAEELALAGYTVVSGMARGIDAEAHHGALGAGAPSIGVLGHGIEGAYPRENAALYREMRARGLLLSEYPPGELPLSGNFPRRNRLIAALSEGVLVVQMALKSGAQHTVTAALELGREVFAVPGPIDVHVCAGTNQLLRDGARLVTSATDILEELTGVGSAVRPGALGAIRVGAAGAASDSTRKPAPRTDPLEAALLGALESEPLHVDALAAALEVPTHRLLAALLALELRGSVEALPGQHYRRPEGARAPQPA